MEDLIRDLVVLLSYYREEDIPMYPAIYVGNQKDDLSPVFNIGQPISLGSIPQSSAAAGIILKDLAPLAKEGWAAFVFSLSERELCYGVFRSSRHSLSTGADEAIAGLGSSILLMLIRNCGHQSVELQNTSGVKLTAVFKIAESAHLGGEALIKLFVRAATSSINDSAEFGAYFRKVLGELIQHSHGTLLAVIPPIGEETPNSVKSGVRLNPHLDLFALHSEALRLRSADSIADLQAAEALLTGMIGSDGIVTFGSDGTLRAYRCFVKPTHEEGVQLSSEGGARRRAFDTLRLRIPAEYVAAFYRSRDGETKCEVQNEL